jgi:hypothetical protein
MCAGIGLSNASTLNQSDKDGYNSQYQQDVDKATYGCAESNIANQPQYNQNNDYNIQKASHDF